MHTKLMRRWLSATEKKSFAALRAKSPNGDRTHTGPLADDQIWRASIHAARGAFDDEILCGVAAFCRHDVKGGADLWLCVEPDWRRQGIGTALLLDCLLAAREQNFDTLRLVFARNNWPMRRIAMKLKAKLDTSWDQMEAQIAVQSRSWNSLTLPPTALPSTDVMVRPRIGAQESRKGRGAGYAELG